MACTAKSEKKFSYLNRGRDKKKKLLYNSIINLPYTNYPAEFDKKYADIIKSNSISSELKKYLEDKAKEKNFWVKGFMKVLFCCGMCTTSRIEAKHRVLKLFLNSGKRLTEVFIAIEEIERKEIINYLNEIDKTNKRARKKEEKSDFINYFKDKYGEYIIERLKDNLIDSTNYKISKVRSYKW